MAERPNILFFHVDNLGFGELSRYTAGPLRSERQGVSQLEESPAENPPLGYNQQRARLILSGVRAVTTRLLQIDQTIILRCPRRAFAAADDSPWWYSLWLDRRAWAR